METLIIGLCILLAISIVSCVILYLMFKIEKPNHFDIVYDHIEEELPKKVVKRKKSTTNAKRKYKKNDEKGSVA